MNVITEIVDKDLCIGCGVCVAMCPTKSLDIKFNAYGELQPYSYRNGCSEKCNLCLKVCAFYHGNHNEDEIGSRLFNHKPMVRYLDPLGYYIETYAGYVLDENRRKKSSSGGLASWFLTQLLKQNRVDHVACVSQVRDTLSFEFKMCSTQKAILECSGSHYCPVEMSSVLRFIRKQPGRYAIVGLPCHLKSVRLAVKESKVLKKSKIVFAGLTCGQLKSMQYTRYLKATSGCRQADAVIRYREKNPMVAANNFLFTAVARTGEKYALTFKDGPHAAWTHKWFTPNPCNFCDDIFAEVSDISFMDAWLHEYMHDNRGTNLLIARTAEAKSIIDGGMADKQIFVEKIDPMRLLASQDGVYQNKRVQLAHRLFLLNKKGGAKVNKRISPSRSYHLFRIYENYLKEKMRMTSRVSFSAHYDHENSSLKTDAFLGDLRPYVKQMNLLARIGQLNLIRWPAAILKKVLKFIKHLGFA